jgi:hypothetical protein
LRLQVCLQNLKISFAILRLSSLAARPHCHIPVRVENGKIIYIEDWGSVWNRYDPQLEAGHEASSPSRMEWVCFE